MLARNIIVGHGGSITAESEGLGKGASFIIHIPREKENLLPYHPEFIGQTPRTPTLISLDYRLFPELLKLQLCLSLL